MIAYFRRALCAALCLLSAPVVLAQSGPPPGYNEAMAKGGGQLDGLSVACGKVSAQVAKAHRSKIRQSLGAKGLAPATFDRIYDAAYTDMLTKAKANPAQMKVACARVSAMGAPGQ